MRHWVLLLLFAVLFAGCQGTKEPELPLMLAAAEGDGVRFYLAPSLREGEEQAIGTWAVPGVIDLAARDGELWLLTETELRRYATEGFSETAAPTEESALTASWPLSKACPEGRLRLGREDVLIVCAADAVYRWHAGTLEAVDTAPFAAFAPASYALMPDPDAGDLFAAAYVQAEGWRFALYAFSEKEALETSPRYSQDLAAPAAPTGFDLALDPTGPTLYVLAAADLDPPALFAYAKAPGKLYTPQTPLPADRVTANLGAAVAYGEGFFAQVGNELYEKATYIPYRAGWLSPDLYLYLAGEEAIFLWDLAGAPRPIGVREIPGIVSLTGFALQ